MDPRLDGLCEHFAINREVVMSHGCKFVINEFRILFVYATVAIAVVFRPAIEMRGKLFDDLLRSRAWNQKSSQFALLAGEPAALMRVFHA